MMRILPQIIITVAFISTLFANQIDAYCTKCVKIEEERAKEQAANPEPWRYYDDIVTLNKSPPHFSSEQERSVNSSKSSDSSSNSSQPKEKANFLTYNSNKPSINEDFFEENETLKALNKETSSTGETPSEKITKISHSPATDPKIYSTIYTIFKTKNFLETLDGSFTLFIPTNEALKQLPPETLINLTRPENEEKLASLVSNHVVARKLLIKDFINYNDLEIKAISGKNLTLSSKDGKLYIDDAQILHVKAAGYDGVIYLIDKVFFTP